MYDEELFAVSPYGEMAEQIFPSLSSKKKRRGGSYGGGFPGLAPLAGSGLPFLAPYVPGVSGMRMVGTGGVPGYGGLTTQQMFSSQVS